MNGTSCFQEVRSSSSQSSINRLREQQAQLGTGPWRLLRTHDLIVLSRGTSRKRKWRQEPFSFSNRIRNHFIGIVILLTIVLVRSTASAAQEIEEALFTSLPLEERSWAEKKSRESLKKDKTLKQVDYVRLRSGEILEKTLRTGLKDPSIRPYVLLLPNISPVTIVTKHVALQSQGFIAWSGRIEGEQGSLVSIVVRESDPSLKKDVALYGTIFLSGRTFRISPAEKDTYAIKEIDTNKYPPEGPPRAWKPKPVQNPLVKHGPPPPRLSDAASLPPLIAEILDVTPPFQNSCQIDVLVAYTSAAKTEAEPASCSSCSIDHEIQDAIALANATYVISKVNQWLHPVNALGVNYETCVTVNTSRTCYAEKGSIASTLETDLDNLLTANPAGSLPPLPAHENYPLIIVHQWRNTLNADLVSLWVQGPQNAQGEPVGDCGRSVQLGEDQDLPGVFDSTFSEQAFSVVSRKCANDIYSMAHEFGHLGAAHHDRPYEAGAPPGNPDTLYSYGFAYPASTWRTIMAQNFNENHKCPLGAQCCTNCTRIPNWSNPDVNYPDAAGVPTGIKDQFPPPPSTPNNATKEISADNHTTLNQSASTVSGFRLPQASPGVCEGSVPVDTTPPAVPIGLRIN